MTYKKIKKVCVLCKKKYKCKVDIDKYFVINPVCDECLPIYNNHIKKVQDEAKKLGHCLCGLEECPCDMYKNTKLCSCAIVHGKEFDEK